MLDKESCADLSIVVSRAAAEVAKAARARQIDPVAVKELKMKRMSDRIERSGYLQGLREGQISMSNYLRSQGTRYVG